MKRRESKLWWTLLNCLFSLPELKNHLLNKWASSFNKIISYSGVHQVDAAKEKKSDNKSSFKEANAKAEKKMEETKNE